MCSPALRLGHTWARVGRPLDTSRCRTVANSFRYLPFPAIPLLSVELSSIPIGPGDVPMPW